MHIQWFPGHMTKALREMEAQLKKVELVIYVLDSRAISSSFNHCFDKLIENKKTIYLLNKADLVEDKDLKKWEEKFKKENKVCLRINSTSIKERNKIIELIKFLTKDIIERYKNKGVSKTIRALVIGMPNTGKSTFINLLSKEKKTMVGNKAGVTRGIQFVKISEYIELYDTPGTLVPSFENQEIAIKLAFLGSIKDDILDISELSLEMIKYFKNKNDLIFLKRYSIDHYDEKDYITLENICKSKGFLQKGQNYDYERASKTIITDFRNQKLGRIMLDEVKD